MIKKKIYDLVIVGAGPAGISSAIYAKRAMLNVLVFEENLIGGKVNKTDSVENYAGFQMIKGKLLSKMMKEQLISLNFQIENQRVRTIKIVDDKNFLLETEKENFLAKSVIVATGTTEKKLEVEGERSLINRGVSYCAVCDGFLFKNKKVMVVGGGYSGCESAVYLSRIAKKVYLVHYSNELKVEMRLKRLVKSSKKIETILNSEVIKIVGKDKVDSSIILINKKEEKKIQVDAVFPCIGLNPNTTLVNELKICDQAKYIEVIESCKTRILGLFSAGDVTKKTHRQIATAIGDGASAAQSAIYYLNNQYGKRENRKNIQRKIKC